MSTHEPKVGTTRDRVLKFIGDDECSMNGIVLGVEGSAAAVRHAVESLIRSGHLKERKERGTGNMYTRRISLNKDYEPEVA